jgi:hypothetical protein
MGNNLPWEQLKKYFCLRAPFPKEKIKEVKEISLKC